MRPTNGNSVLKIEDRIRDSADLVKQQHRVPVLMYVREFDLDIAYSFALMAWIAGAWITFPWLIPLAKWGSSGHAFIGVWVDIIQTPVILIKGWEIWTFWTEWAGDRNLIQWQFILKIFTILILIYCFKLCCKSCLICVSNSVTLNGFVLWWLHSMCSEEPRLYGLWLR